MNKDATVGSSGFVEDAAIEYYNLGKKLVPQINGFLSTLENKFGKRLKSVLQKQGDEKCRYYDEKDKKNEGLYGFGFCESPKKKWNPGFFVGFHLDVEAKYWRAVETDNWLVEPIAKNKSPDFSLIVVFDAKYCPKYPNNAFYKNFKDDIRSIIKTTKFKWDIYDIAKNSGDQSECHPIHLRVPMQDMFTGTETIDKQADRFFEYIEDIVPKITALTSLQKMKEKFR